MPGAVPCLPPSNAARSNPGEYAQGVGSYTCSTCQPGTYSDQPGSTSCAACGGGKYTVNVNGRGATGCLMCAKGTYKAPDATDNKCRRWASGSGGMVHDWVGPPLRQLGVCWPG